MSQRRITFNLTEEQKERLRRLKEKTGATSEAEVLRKAIRFLALCAQVVSQGGEVRFERPDGKTISLELLLV